MARLTAGQDAGLHGHLAEVLQLAVDVQVPDAAVEAGAVLPGGLAQSRSCVVLPGHAWGGTRAQASGALGDPEPGATHTLFALLGGWPSVRQFFRRTKSMSIQSCGSHPGPTLESHRIWEEIPMPGPQPRPYLMRLSGWGCRGRWDVCFFVFIFSEELQGNYHAQ